MIQRHIEKVLSEIEKYKYNCSCPVENIIWKKGTFKGGECLEIDTSDWQTYNKGDKWNGFLEHCWFRAEVELPIEMEGHDVVIETQTGCEGFWDFINPQMLGYVDGKLVHALDQNHREIIVGKDVKGGQKLLVAFYVYSGRDKQSPAIELRLSLRGVNSNVKRLYNNIYVPLETAKILSENCPERVAILNCLDKAISLLDFRNPQSTAFMQSVDSANEYLESELFGKLCSSAVDENTPVFHSVGHSHLDVAWGWTVTETREKAVRTFANMLDIMDRYPSYTYVQSQPVLYKFVKEGAPELYEKMKQRVKEGRWEPEGAMWLEADCNLTCGESLVRQILFGKRFFKNELEYDSKVLWLPDVFGYSASLPQILRKTGVKYFMTTKIGWNEYNSMPHTTFNWEGIDGSEVLTQLVPSYGSAVWASEFKDAYEAYPEKASNNEMLFMYGFSDGGGGASDEMLERHIRFEKGIPGLPKVKQSSVHSFFESVESNYENNEDNPRCFELPKWVGELYLEYHRGTYTSVARNKKNNRRSEIAYQNLEVFSQLCKSLSDEFEYPQKELNDNWELILLNQFHDIIPGSSDPAVYEESDADYAKIFQNYDETMRKISLSLADTISLDANSVLILNGTGFLANGYAYIDIDQHECKNAREHEFDYVLQDCDGNAVVSQLVNMVGTPFFSCTAECLPSEGVQATEEASFGDKNRLQLMFPVRDVPAKGYKMLCVRRVNQANAADRANVISMVEKTESGMILETEHYSLALNKAGQFTSVYDRKNNREVLREGGRGNILQAFEDMPLAFNSWDINLFYQEKQWEVNDTLSCEIVENGVHRAAIKVVSKFNNSLIQQYIYLYADSARIDFANNVDWREQQVLLKTSFELDVHNDFATYDIQFGNVRRPTHWNTSWDQAKFEVCAQKWADLSEKGYGVSILNDCKYGHDIKDGVMRLTLLKSSGGWPFPMADNEIHSFTYSIFPHDGDWIDAEVHKEATLLNNPLVCINANYSKLRLSDLPNDDVARSESKIPNSMSLVSVDTPNICVDTVKKAEDSDDLIIRMYEFINKRTKTVINLPEFLRIKDVYECDMLENEISKIESVSSNGNSSSCNSNNSHDNGSETQIYVDFKPYEIKTLKITLF